MPEHAGLLRSLRILDLSGGTADAIGRILADLGADVLKVEPPGGSPARTELPTVAGTSIAFALHNANKRSTVLDPATADDRRRLCQLAESADIVIDSGQLAAYQTDCRKLAAQHRHLVTLSVTDFGLTGPRADWRASDAVLYALSSVLSRSGPPVGTPVLPPDGIAAATAAVQAAWSVLVAYFRRLRCGQGDFIDFARLDAVLLALDPPFGSHGQAAAASGAEKWRGRPRNQDPYPIIACADGYVRLVVMAPRQWRGLRAWMGEPEAFQDPKFDAIGERFAAWDQIGALLEKQFAGQTMDDLVSTGQSFGVPIAPVLEPSTVLATEHFRAADATTRMELVPGVTAAVPVGYFTVDGKRAGIRTPAPPLGAADAVWVDGQHDAAPAAQRLSPLDEAALPFTGLRILDLGIIVAGGELGRQFADLGAEVIKVESLKHPDGLRQGRPGQRISESFAWTHRNKLGLGLELRAAGAAEVFTELVATADAVFANFKPGTLAGLGFGYQRLAEINPRIVLAESSAFGDVGPWSDRMGYGPLVRSATGVTALWTSEAAPSGRHPFFDATTVFPDHVVARITAIGALAALIHREHSGTGARIHVSQAEAGVNQLDTAFVTDALLAEHPEQVRPSDARHEVYPAPGDDEWWVISTDSSTEQQAVDLLGERSGWPEKTRTAADLAATLQAAGVRAAAMQRRPDVLVDPQLAARQLYQSMTHPLITAPQPAESGPSKFSHLGAVATRPAPLPGEDTRAICRRLLGLSDSAIDTLIADGVLFETRPDNG